MTLVGIDSFMPTRTSIIDPCNDTAIKTVMPWALAIYLYRHENIILINSRLFCYKNIVHTNPFRSLLLNAGRCEHERNCNTEHFKEFILT